MILKRNLQNQISSTSKPLCSIKGFPSKDSAIVHVSRLSDQFWSRRNPTMRISPRTKSLIPAVLAMETLEREFLSGCYLCFLPSRPRAGFGAQAKGRVRSARPDAKPLNGAATVVGGQDFPTDWGRCSCLLGYGWTARRRSGGSESSDCGR